MAPSDFFIRYSRYLAVDMWARTQEGEVSAPHERARDRVGWKYCPFVAPLLLLLVKECVSPSFNKHPFSFKNNDPLSMQGAWFGLVESRLRLLVDILDRDPREVPGMGQVRPAGRQSVSGSLSVGGWVGVGVGGCGCGWVCFFWGGSLGVWVCGCLVSLYVGVGGMGVLGVSVWVCE